MTLLVEKQIVYNFTVLRSHRKALPNLNFLNRKSRAIWAGAIMDALACLRSETCIPLFYIAQFGQLCSLFLPRNPNDFFLSFQTSQPRPPRAKPSQFVEPALYPGQLNLITTIRVLSRTLAVLGQHEQHAGAYCRVPCHLHACILLCLLLPLVLCNLLVKLLLNQPFVFTACSLFPSQYLHRVTLVFGESPTQRHRETVCVVRSLHMDFNLRLNAHLPALQLLAWIRTNCNS